MKTLLQTSFQEFPVGMFSAPVGPHTEYHFLPEAAPKHGWAVACFGTGRKAGTAWHTVEQDGDKAMRQTITNDKRHTHPTVVAGDSLWGDYTLTVRFQPGTKAGDWQISYRSAGIAGRLDQLLGQPGHPPLLRWRGQDLSRCRADQYGRHVSAHQLDRRGAGTLCALA